MPGLAGARHARPPRDVQLGTGHLLPPLGSGLVRRPTRTEAVRRSPDRLGARERPIDTRGPLRSCGMGVDEMGGDAVGGDHDAARAVHDCTVSDGPLVGRYETGSSTPIVSVGRSRRLPSGTTRAGNGFAGWCVGRKDGRRRGAQPGWPASGCGCASAIWPRGCWSRAGLPGSQGRSRRVRVQRRRRLRRGRAGRCAASGFCCAARAGAGDCDGRRGLG